MDKRGDFDVAQKSIFFVIAVMILSAFIFGFIWIISSFSKLPTTVHDVSYLDAYTERFLGNPDCFAYVNPDTGNVYSGVIDLSKFTSERLNSCYVPNTDSSYEFFLTLEYNGNQTKIASENYKTISKQIPIYVLVMNNNQLIKGKLLLGVGGLSE